MLIFKRHLYSEEYVNILCYIVLHKRRTHVLFLLKHFQQIKLKKYEAR
jgi:hypothetical protein